MKIEIAYDLDRMAGNKKRVDAAMGVSMHGRPPVMWGVANRMMLMRRGKSFPDLFDEPVNQIINLVENFRWVAENLPGDMVTEPAITIQPQFENASNSNALGSPVAWYDHEPPVAQPCLHTVDDLERYEPPPVETTLWGRMARYYHAMRRWLDDGNLEVTLGGAPVKLDLQLHTGGESPFVIATDLCGGKIYEWMYEAPDALHRLLDIITARLIETELEFRRISGLPPRMRWFMTDDTAQIISLEDFREFVVPYTNRVYDALTETREQRIQHLCGRHVHLYPALVEDMRIAGIWGYGWSNEPEEVRDGFAGHGFLIGNLSPVLLNEGPRDEIVGATRRLLEHLAPKGGLIVGDGYNLVPETPIENLQLVVDTVEEYYR